MIRINRQPEKKYRVVEIAKALGLSEGAVAGYYKNRAVSTKDGLTIEQIYERCLAPTRDDVRWGEVEEIRHKLNALYGVEIIYSGDESEESGNE